MQDHFWGDQAVLESPGLLCGLHSWRTRLLFKHERFGFNEAKGVLATLPPSLFDTAASSFSWETGTRNGKYCGKGRETNERFTVKWKSSDVIEMTLDCENHTTATNLDSGQTDVIRNLPHTRLFPYYSFLLRQGKLYGIA